MTIFISQGRYTERAMKGFLDKPEDRSQAVKRIIEGAGAKFIAFYLTYGEYDFLVIAEADSEIDMAGVLMAVGASGIVSGMKTTIALSGPDAKTAMERGQQVARNYPMPGG